MLTAECTHQFALLLDAAQPVAHASRRMANRDLSQVKTGRDFVPRRNMHQSQKLEIAQNGQITLARPVN